jgi:hypothetical protein
VISKKLMYNYANFHLSRKSKSQIVLAPIEVPSAAFFDTAIASHFVHFHPSFPIIHCPTFEPRRTNPLLLLAISATGARFIDTPRTRAFCHAVFERLAIALQRAWKTQEQSYLELFIVAIMVQTHGLFSGDRGLLSGAFTMHGSVIA